MAHHSCIISGVGALSGCLYPAAKATNTVANVHVPELKILDRVVARFQYHLQLGQIMVEPGVLYIGITVQYCNLHLGGTILNAL